MIHTIPFLTLASMLPILAAILVAAINYGIHHDRYTRTITIIGGLVNLIWLSYITISFDFTEKALQFSEEFMILDNLDLSYHAGIDSLSLSMMWLNAVVDFIALLASLWMIKKSRNGFIFTFMLMPGLVNGVFAAQNLLQFFIFFEASLIPMYFMIGKWGGENCKYAAYKFFLYTLAGSMCLLVAMCYILVEFNTLDLVALMNILPGIEFNVQIMLFLAMLLAFLVKVPTPPFHTWLPDAHVQAPTPASALLAGILLKLGGYAIIRILLPLFPDAAMLFSPYMLVISMIAIIYGSLVAIAQVDMKKMIAYSSVAHMGFVTAGIFSMKLSGIQGAVYQMISHGIVSSALFLVIGMLYDRLHTKKIDAYGGVTTVMPNLGLLYMVFTLAAIGLPGTVGFIGEFIVISTLFQVHPVYAFCAGLGVVLGAVYMLTLYKKLMLGEINNKEVLKFQDLSRIEHIILWPLALLVLYLGVQSTELLEFLKQSLMLIISV